MATFIFGCMILAVYVAVYQYPGAACGLVLASYAIEQYAETTVPIAAAVPPLCNYLTAGAVLIALLAQFIRNGAGVFKIHPPGAFVLGLLAYCYATSLWTLFPSTTAHLLRTHIPYLAVFVGLAPMTIQRAKDMEHAVLGLIVGGTLSLLALILFGQWEGRGVLLLTGAESNPLAIAQTAGSLLIAASLTDVVPKFFPKAWLMIAGGIGCAVLFAFLRSGSRGQILAATSVTFLFAAFRRDRWWMHLFAVGLMGLLAVGLLESEVQQNASRWDLERVESDVGQARGGQAALLLDIWARSAPFRVWFGLGNGASQDPRALGAYPHVVPAEVLAEEGIVGFCIYAAAIGASVLAYVRAQSSQKADYRNLILATGGLCTYEFMLTLKQGTLFGGASFLLLLVLPGPLTRKSWRPEIEAQDELGQPVVAT